MALEDVRMARRWKSNLWRILERFLDAHVGHKWDEVYSKMCQTIDVRTEEGRQLHRYIEREVEDLRQKKVGTFADWYVDAHGMLWKYPKHSWKTDWKNRYKNLPVSKIVFQEDNHNLWYELHEVPDKYHRNKYTKVQLIWFRVDRTVETKTTPVEDLSKAWKPEQVKKGRRGYYREYTREVIRQTQCNSRVVKVLKEIATKESSKIVRLVQNERHPDTRMVTNLMAVVKGKSN